MRTIRFIAALFGALVILACGSKPSPKQTSTSIRTFDCETFTMTYPPIYHVEQEELRSDLHKLYFYYDSINDWSTTIIWGNSRFPSTNKDFVSAITYKEMESYGDTFYDIMLVDSLYLVDGRPTYTMVSIYEEDSDTIIQSRMGVEVNDTCSLLIVQKLKARSPESRTAQESALMESIRFK